MLHLPRRVGGRVGGHRSELEPLERIETRKEARPRECERRRLAHEDRARALGPRTEHPPERLPVLARQEKREEPEHVERELAEIEERREAEVHERQEQDREVPRLPP